MTKLYKYQDGNTVEITGDELTDLLAIREEYAARKEAESQAELEKVAKKAAAEAKLAALGLDADDLKALGLV
jgi:hypothetical protein